MLAPEPYLSACLEVLYQASIHARMIGWAGEQGGLTAEQSAEVADLMDAVHNIPHLLQNWETCDESMLRAFLEGFDTKWKSETSARLLGTYEAVLEAKRPRR
jgi:hypothetical protein